MLVKKIAIIVDTHFSSRDYIRFGVSELQKKFDITVFDCSNWLNPGYSKRHPQGNNFQGTVIIADFNEFQKTIIKMENSIVIDQLGVGYSASKVRRALKKAGIPRVIIHNGLLPTQKVGARVFLSALTNPLRFFLKAFKFVARKIYVEPFADIALMSGSAGVNDRRISLDTHKIWAHSFDYEIFRNLPNEIKENSDSNYAVFLDENIIDHSDYDYLGIHININKEEYYLAINRFFLEFERFYGLPVLVAIHPRFQERSTSKDWFGRKVVYGNTAELVGGAKVVFCHQTTAVSFAVLFRKPLILLTSKDIQNSFLGQRVKSLSNLLDATLIDLDLPYYFFGENRKLFNINEKSYINYEDLYIKRIGTPNISIWESLANFIAKYK